VHVLLYGQLFHLCILISSCLVIILLIKIVID
jgi:hypothetical protein